MYKFKFTNDISYKPIGIKLTYCFPIFIKTLEALQGSKFLNSYMCLTFLLYLERLFLKENFLFSSVTEFDSVSIPTHRLVRKVQQCS